MDAPSMAEANLSRKVPNFRRLAGTKLYRSSFPGDLDIQGVESLRSLGIHSILDLRSYHEKDEVNSDTYLNQVYPIEELPSLSQTSGQEGCAPTPRPQHVHYRCDLLGSRDYLYNTLRREGAWFTMNVVFLTLWDKIFGSQRFKSYVVRECINKRGQCSMYKDLADFCPRHICKALELFCEPESVPALVFCNHGKDRTGVICALVLHCMGCTQEEIANDYVKSEKEVQGLPTLTRHMEKFNLKPEFGMASLEMIEEFLDHLKSKYGSIDGYLDSIGFDKAKQGKLKQNLSSADRVPDHNI